MVFICIAFTVVVFAILITSYKIVIMSITALPFEYLYEMNLQYLLYLLLW